MRLLATFWLFSAFLLTGCIRTDVQPIDPNEDVSEEPSQEEQIPVTRNVTYTGIVDELGITIYQQGTHRLTLENGGFILLESDDPALDLERYVGQRVEVRGTVRPTVETGGTIMGVELVTSFADPSPSLGGEGAMCGGFAALPCDEGLVCMDDPNEDCDPDTGADCAGICVLAEDVTHEEDEDSSSSPHAEEQEEEDSTASPVSPTSPPTSPSSPSPAPPEEEELEQNASESAVLLMAEQRYDDPSLWSQQYCTTHIGFCIPVHRNWYYKSFGATTSNLWHVEFGISPIDNLGDGPIVLHLSPGSLSSVGVPDNHIASSNGRVIGYRNWDESRHFRIVADARLRDAVAHMLASVTSVSQEQ